MSRRALAAGALAAGLAAAPAAATTVDCAHPGSPVERLICANPDLGATEDGMSAAYRRVIDRLSDAGRGLMGENQHAWSNYVAGICPLADADADICFAREYRRRAAALESVVVESGPFLFAAVESFAAKPAPTRPGPPEVRFLTRRLAYPRIDQPGSSAGDAWNRAVAEAAKAFFGQPDDRVDERWLDWRIAYADAKVISLLFSQVTFEHGAQHPQTERSTFTWWLGRRQAVTAERLFDAAKPWARTMARAAQALLKAAAERAPARTAEPSVERLARLVADEHRWLFGPAGLTILLDEDGPGRGERRVEVPWTEITPLLRADAELPVRVEAPAAAGGGAPVPAATVANDWLLVPGQRAGPVTPQLTSADLRRLFGADYADQLVDGAEGQQFPGGQLYGSKPAQALTLIFDDQLTCTAVLAGTSSRWRLDSGLSLGASLARLEELNGKPFKVTNFGVADGGYVDFDSGRLQALSVQVAPSPDSVTDDELARLGGDDQIPSTDPLLRKARPVVVEIDVRLCP